MHLVRYEQNGSLCCSGCGAQGPITVIGDANQADATGLATAAWNSRPDDQQSQATERLREAEARIAELEIALRYAVGLLPGLAGAYDKPDNAVYSVMATKGEILKARAALSVTEPSAEGGVS